MLQRRASLAAFLTSPFDAYLELPWLLAWADQRRSGVCVAGVFDRRRVNTFFQALEMDLHADASARLSVVDFRGVTHTDLATMGHFLASLRDRMPRFAKRVRKRLIVAPKGPLSIAFGGLQFQVRRLYPVRVTTDLAAGLRWLGIAQTDPLLGWVEQRRAALMGVDLFINQVTATVDAGARSVSECARALGLSSRTLQRALAQRRTSFTTLRQRLRLQRARDLLRNSTLSLSEIAHDCGFASQQHFATAFREQCGLTPSAFRRAPGANL